MCSFILLLFGFAAAPSLVSATVATAGNTTLRPILLADTNRDGIISILDHKDRHTWTESSGAVFLPNIGDSRSRCPTSDLLSEALGNEELAACSDASGEVLITPHLAAPMMILPLSGLSENATGRIYTTPQQTIDRVRIFWKHSTANRNSSSSWSLVTDQVQFNATRLSAGITLAIDGRGLVTDSSRWNGSVKVVFQVTDANHTAEDIVELQQAPVLIHHHLQNPQHVFATSGAKQTYPHQTKFTTDLQALLSRIKPNLPPLTLFNQSDDIWAQDFFEPAFASMPGPDGGHPISIRINLRSMQSERNAGRQMFTQLRGPNVGAFQPGRGSGYGWEEINSGGNIETIPPYTSRQSGIAYPNGRVIMGKHFGKYPATSMVKFLQSQKSQTPLFLETGWLAVGHVDEMIQFLPFNNKLGFTIAIADTKAGFDILKRAQKDGHGSNVVTSFNGSMTPDPGTIFLDPYLHNTTIDAILAEGSFIKTNEYAQKYIDQNLELLLNEIPLDRKDILRIPVLWKDVTYPWPNTPDGLPPRLHRTTKGEFQVKSFYPEAINGLVLGSYYIAPRPWGPVISGQDIFATAIEQEYKKANMKVEYLDDYMSHHVRGGEVHCGTNTWRDADVKWWK